NPLTLPTEHQITERGMARQGFDRQLTRYDEHGWRATFYTTGMEHSPTARQAPRWIARRGPQRAAWRRWTAQAANNSHLLDSRQPFHTEVSMRLIGLAVVFALSLVLAPPFAGGAQQQAEKVYRVGWIVSSPTATPHLQAAFRLGLSERGYVEGKNLIFERRYHEGQLQRYPELVADIVRLQVDTIFVAGDRGSRSPKTRQPRSPS